MLGGHHPLANSHRVCVPKIMKNYWELTKLLPQTPCAVFLAHPVLRSDDKLIIPDWTWWSSSSSTAPWSSVVSLRWSSYLVAPSTSAKSYISQRSVLVKSRHARTLVEKTPNSIERPTEEPSSNSGQKSISSNLTAVYRRLGAEFGSRTATYVATVSYTHLRAHED